MKTRFGVVALVAMAWAGQALAADPPSQYKPQDVINAYGKSGKAQCPAGTVAADDGACDPTPTVRGFSLASPDGKPATSAAPARAKGAAAYRPVARLKSAVSPGDLLINFERGSAELTPQGRSNARAFAEALKSPALSPYRFALGGHTDTSGAAPANDALSQSRADAVKAFLVQQGVSADRLEAQGYGSARLSDPAHPRSPTNRRVEGLRLN